VAPPKSHDFVVWENALVKINIENKKDAVRVFIKN